MREQQAVICCLALLAPAFNPAAAGKGCSIAPLALSKAAAASGCGSSLFLPFEFYRSPLLRVGLVFCATDASCESSWEAQEAAVSCVVLQESRLLGMAVPGRDVR